MKYVSTAFLLSLVLATGCKDEPVVTDSGTVDSSGPGDPDIDNDGFPASEDCEDEDPSINPGAVEVCDGIDNNCDGVADEGVTTTYYQDSDAERWRELMDVILGG